MHTCHGNLLGKKSVLYYIGITQKSRGKDIKLIKRFVALFLTGEMDNPG